MSNLIVIDVKEDLENEQVSLSVLQKVKRELQETTIQAVSAFDPSLLAARETWLDSYSRLYKNRGRKVKNQVTAKSSPQVILDNFKSKSRQLEAELNQWLNHPELKEFRDNLQHLLDESGAETQVLVRADNFQFWQIPWHRWHLLQDYEVGLSYTHPKPVFRPLLDKDKVRILALLGNSEGICVEEDINALYQLPNAEVQPLVNPSRQEVFEALRNREGWDILFFAGHSVTENEEGRIYINDAQETITITELKQTLKDAIGLGLKLAIFNSCDGLGLAKELASLYIPSLIVMSEPVPDLVAQAFLKELMQYYSQGDALNVAVSKAKQKLKELDSQYPCASWLPVICQNPVEKPYLWQELATGNDTPTWQGACRAVQTLAATKRLQENILTNRERIGYEIEEVFIPLGLVEKQQQEKQDRETKDGFLEVGFASALLENREVTFTYEQDAFFNQVLQGKSSPKSKGQRLLITGEAGAGKTTLLQKIADWIFESTNDVGIWVSLKALGNRNLEDYLLSDWLTQANQKVRLPNASPEGLKALFQQGNVWLLLDGVDEMGGTTPLRTIVSQLQGWLGKARVVMSCRVNTWDSEKNAVDGFDIYRNLDFSYGEGNQDDQVKGFIDLWFRGQPELGGRLRQEIEVTGRERVKDLVKNPLRLSLLCASWENKKGDFPETRAELYQGFVETIFDWKGEVFGIEPSQQQNLIQRFSVLALRGLNKKEAWFRLERELVEKFLNEELLEFALKLGWLNVIGTGIFAFFHSSFQEYFAALGINNWHYFLNHNPRNPNPLLESDPALEYYQGKPIYRIFDKQWREVYLFWLGRREDELLTNEQKDSLLRKLTFFGAETICNKFYAVQAFVLALQGTNEFKESRHNNTMFGKLILSLRDECFDISYSDHEKEKIVKINIPDFCNQFLIHQLLNKTIGNARMISFYKEQMENLEATMVWKGCCASMIGMIQPGDPEALSLFAEYTLSKDNEEDLARNLYLLGCTTGDNIKGIKTLVSILEIVKDIDIKQQVIEGIGATETYNQEAAKLLLKILYNPDNEEIFEAALYSLGKICRNSPDKKAIFEEALYVVINYDQRMQAEFNQADYDIAVVAPAITNFQKKVLELGKALTQIAKGDAEVISYLENFLQSRTIGAYAMVKAEAEGCDFEEAVDSFGNPELFGEEDWKYFANTVGMLFLNKCLGEVSNNNTTALTNLFLLLKGLCQDRKSLLTMLICEEWLTNYVNENCDQKNRRDFADFYLRYSHYLLTIKTIAEIGENCTHKGLIELLEKELNYFNNFSVENYTRQKAKEDYLKNIRAIVSAVRKIYGKSSRQRSWKVNLRLSFFHFLAYTYGIWVYKYNNLPRYRFSYYWCISHLCHSLKKIDPNNPLPNQTLEKILNQLTNQLTKIRVADKLSLICFLVGLQLEMGEEVSNTSIKYLTQYFRKNPSRQKTEIIFIWGLLEKRIKQKYCINRLIEILLETESEEIRKEALGKLKEFLDADQFPHVIQTLKQRLTSKVEQENPELYSAGYEIIWHCSQNMPYAEFYRVWHSQPSRITRYYQATKDFIMNFFGSFSKLKQVAE